eukprot:jgi/Mesvir1/14356/Mv09763-RA.3
MGRSLFDESTVLKGHSTSTDHGLLDSRGNVRSNQPLGKGGSLQIGSAEGIYVAPVSREWRLAAEDSGVPIKSFIATGVLPVKKANAALATFDRSDDSTPLLSALKNQGNKAVLTENEGAREEMRLAGGVVSVQPYPPARPRSAPQRMQDISAPMPSGRSLVGDLNWSREYSDLLLPRPMRPEVVLPSQIFTPLSLQKTPRVTQHQQFWNHMSRPRVVDADEPPFAGAPLAPGAYRVSPSSGTQATRAAAHRGRPAARGKTTDARLRVPTSWLGVELDKVALPQGAQDLLGTRVADTSDYAPPSALRYGRGVGASTSLRQPPPTMVTEDSYEYYCSHPDIFPVGQDVLPYPRPASAVASSSRRPGHWSHPDKAPGRRKPSLAPRAPGYDSMAPASALAVLRSEGGGWRAEPRATRQSRQSDPDAGLALPHGDREQGRSGLGYDARAGSEGDARLGTAGPWHGAVLEGEGWRGRGAGYGWEQDSLASLPRHLNLDGEGRYYDDDEVPVLARVVDGRTGRRTPASGVGVGEAYVAPLPRASPGGYRPRSRDGHRQLNALIASDDDDVLDGANGSTGGPLSAATARRGQPRYAADGRVGGNQLDGGRVPAGPLEQLQREQRRWQRSGRRHVSPSASGHRRSRASGSSTDEYSSGSDAPNDRDIRGRDRRHGARRGSGSSSGGDNQDVGSKGAHRAHRGGPFPARALAQLRVPTRDGGDGDGNSALPRTSAARVLHAAEPEGDIMPRSSRPRRRYTHAQERTDELDVSCRPGHVPEDGARSPSACVRRVRWVPHLSLGHVATYSDMLLLTMLVMSPGHARAWLIDVPGCHPWSLAHPDVSAHPGVARATPLERMSYRAVLGGLQHVYLDADLALPRLLVTRLPLCNRLSSSLHPPVGTCSFFNIILRTKCFTEPALERPKERAVASANGLWSSPCSPGLRLPLASAPGGGG